MRQWIVEYVVDTTSGPKVRTESLSLPKVEDVRRFVQKKGGYTLTIRAHERSPIERLFARSTWWQIQLLRGILFRATSTSPSVALWRMIESETNPMRQNILSPAKDALSQGLGVIDALKALSIFDHSTMAILHASERSNKLREGIPHAIQTITQKRKNTRAIAGTMSWLAVDIVMIVQAMFWGKDFILGWFEKNAPKDEATLEEYSGIVSNLSLLWDVLIWIAIGAGVFLVWAIASHWLNRGKQDFAAARMVRRIPLIGAYLRDIGFADSTSAAARMIRGNVPIGDSLEQSAQATNVPEVSQYWIESFQDLKRGVSLGVALDRAPLNRNERLEVAGLSDLSQVATILESIAEMRQMTAKTKHSLILWLAFGLSGLYLVIAFGSAIYALTLMNLSVDSMMGDFLGGAGGL